jgi:putative ABC transport system permease protein
MAFTSLLRNKRRTLTTVTGVAVGSFCTYMFYGFVQNTYWGLSEKFARSGNGHIQVAQAEWFSSPHPERNRTSQKDFFPIIQAISADPEIKNRVAAISLKRKISGIIGTAESSEVFVGQGIDPAAHQKMSTWVNVVKGQNLNSSDPYSVLVGRVLAEKLQVTPGDSASLLLSTDDGRTNAADVKISGLIDSASKDADAVALIIPFETAIHLVNSPLVDVLVIGLYRTEDSEPVLQRLNEILKRHSSTGLIAKSWSEVAEFYRSVKTLYDGIFGFIQIVLFVLTLLAVGNTIVMAVVERRQEIGVLRAIGMKPSQVVQIFFVEGILLGGIGSLIGLCSAWIVALLIKVSGGLHMPPAPGSSQGYTLNFLLHIRGGLLILTLMLLSTGIAALIPSRRGSKEVIAKSLAGALILMLLVVAPFGRLRSQAFAASSPQALLQVVDKLRDVPVGGFVTESTFTKLGNDVDDEGRSVTYRVAGLGSRVLAVAISDQPGERLCILSAGKGMWMQKEGMRKPIRISPGQRLMGQASTADVVSVQFSADYDAIELKPVESKKNLLVLKPKPNSENAAYGRIELYLDPSTHKPSNGRFFSLSGKILKTVEYSYVSRASKPTLDYLIIADAMRTDLKTKVTVSQLRPLALSSSFFNSEAIVESSRKLGAPRFFPR